mmetsp:Transcript_25362/g.33102  ORF Transcript_25362/g.33102 Transcript_25362/m.33102 type:complete len:1104 (+) Transcript_25362:37-3348(+)
MDKYSRQIGAYGLEAMSKLVRLRVLIIGMKGVGIETAKNLVLAGPGGVTICDDTPTTLRDLGSNFFLTEEDVGKPRAQVVMPKLQELNPMVQLRTAEGGLTEELVSQHQAVVFTRGSQADLERWDNFCRTQSPPIAFLACDTKGPSGYIFSDFGPAFTVRDSNGENPLTRIVTHISNDEEGIVTLLGAFGEDGGRVHGLEENDHDGWIEISDVEGMESAGGQSINDHEPFKIQFCTKAVTRTETKDGEKVQVTKQVFDPFRLKIGDTSKFSDYINGGVITQVKKPFVKNFRSFSDNLWQPVAPGDFGLLFTDGAKFGRGEQLHFAFRALWEFEAEKGRMPAPYNSEEADMVVDIAKRLVEDHAAKEDAVKIEELDEEVVRKIAQTAGVEMQPLCAFFGGVVAQEIVKITGKFSPLNQWLHIDWLEVLPSDQPMDAQAQESRYDDIIEMFGAGMLEKIQNAKTFMVGCGALGCEFLKNFALLGLATGPNGLVTVTDNDRIEVSNLNRQFLFRQHNVGQPKSVAASNAVAAMNDNIKIDCKEALVAPHTENLFPDQFWESLDFVTNALDNVKARHYVDGRCVFYGKPLLESGTLGTKCNVQVVIPHITASYSDGPDDDANEDAIPMCTLRNFPSLIDHCIEWARAQFEDTFSEPFGEVKKMLSGKNEYLDHIEKTTISLPNGGTNASETIKQLEVLTGVKTLLEKARGIDFEQCLEEALKIFHSQFRDKILDLIGNFPQDHVTSTGEKFWTGAKRFPTAAEFDPEDEQHLNFIIATANILAACYNLVPSPEVELLPEDHKYRNVEYVKKIIGTLDIPAYRPSGKKIELEEEEEGKSEEKKVDAGDAPEELRALLQELRGLDIAGVKMEPADFEKDQDLNFHIDFITAGSNLRAANYRIKQASRHKCKMIAGKIIPAIATTTASVCGLVMMELLKLLQGKSLEAFKDSSNNLGLNMFFLQEPQVPSKAKDEYDPINMAETKCQPPGFTKWDKTFIDKGDLTLKQFLDAFKEVTGLNCTLLLHGVGEIEGPQKGLMLYDSMAWKAELKALYESKMDTSLVEWVKERYADSPVEVLAENRKYVELQVSCENDAGDPYKVPTVVYRFAH